MATLGADDQLGSPSPGAMNLIIVVEGWHGPGKLHLVTGGNQHATTAARPIFSDTHWTNYPARFYRVRSP